MSDWIRERDTKYSWLGAHVQQLPSALLWFDRMITAYGIGSVMELGTGVGTLTCLFGMRCPDSVMSVDIEDRRSEKTKDLFTRLGISFSRLDLRDPETVARFARFSDVQCCDGAPMLMFIDSGDSDKEREFSTYTNPENGLLKPGDLVVVHDCGSQFFPDAPANIEAARTANLKRILVKELDADKTRVAAYLVDGK